MAKQKPILLPAIERFLSEVSADQILEDRKLTLREIADYVTARLDAGKAANLIFICTHNSRRSHMSQIWAYAAALFYGIRDVQCYSGGTEATAFHPNAVRAMRKAGFEITQENKNSNPVYQVKYAETAPPLRIFSKKYDDAANPVKDFAAVMTCAQADQECPVVLGADFRATLPYEDPKLADGTPEEEATYDERCRQIAAEMNTLFSNVDY